MVELSQEATLPKLFTGVCYWKERHCFLDSKFFSYEVDSFSKEPWCIRSKKGHSCLSRKNDRKICQTESFSLEAHIHWKKQNKKKSIWSQAILKIRNERIQLKEFASSLLKGDYSSWKYEVSDPHMAVTLKSSPLRDGEQTFPRKHTHLVDNPLNYYCSEKTNYCIPNPFFLAFQKKNFWTKTGKVHLVWPLRPACVDAPDSVVKCTSLRHTSSYGPSCLQHFLSTFVLRFQYSHKLPCKTEICLANNTFGQSSGSERSDSTCTFAPTKTSSVAEITNRWFSNLLVTFGGKFY